MYSPQEPDPSQPKVESYPPPPPGANSYPYPPSGAYPYPPPQQPGMAPSYPYPPPSYSYPPQQPGMAPYPYPPQGPYVPQGQKVQNRRARTAMIDGIISIALSMITLFTQAGIAGVITGTFAIFYGFTALKIAKQLPGNAGRTQAITGIVLGFVAWFLIIVSLIIRSTTRI